MPITFNNNVITATGTLTYTVSSSTVAEIVDTLGNIVDGQRPAFKDHAGSTGGSEWSNYGDYLPNIFNQGGYFNRSTGQFTAPITGVYHFDMNCMTTGGTSDARFSLYKNGGGFGPKTIVVASNGSHNNCGFSCTVPMAAGDYVRPIMYSGSNAHDASWNTFSGYLVSVQGGV
jgi:hypothetical protein